MKKLISHLLLLGSVFGAVCAFAGGTVTETVSRTRPIQKITLAYTTSTNGEATFTTTNAYGGVLYRIVYTVDTNIPTTLFDMTLVDSDGADILGGTGANLSTAVLTRTAPVDVVTLSTTNATVPLARAIDGTLSLAVTNAGSLKSGTVSLYVR